VLGAKAKDWMELIENPANTLVSGGVNVLGAKGAQDSASRADPPAGSPLSLLSQATEAIAGHQRRFEEALLKRREALDSSTTSSGSSSRSAHRRRSTSTCSPRSSWPATAWNSSNRRPTSP
jgi:hypothetical protein